MSLRNGRSRQACFQGENRRPGIAGRGIGPPGHVAAELRPPGAEAEAGPEVVAEAIGKAVQLRRPRTRYAVGGGARSILLAQRLLTDRGFDRLIRLTYRVLS